MNKPTIFNFGIYNTFLLNAKFYIGFEISERIVRGNPNVGKKIRKYLWNFPNAKLVPGLKTACLLFLITETISSAWSSWLFCVEVPKIVNLLIPGFKISDCWQHQTQWHRRGSKLIRQEDRKEIKRGRNQGKNLLPPLIMAADLKVYLLPAKANHQH